MKVAYSRSEIINQINTKSTTQGQIMTQIMTDYLTQHYEGFFLVADKLFQIINSPSIAQGYRCPLIVNLGVFIFSAPRKVTP